MKTHNLARRGSAAAAVLALTVSLAACSSEDEPAPDATDEETSAPAETPSETETETEPEPASDEPFGAGCVDIPTNGDGSFDGMVNDTVATAAGNNPLLETLVTAVGAAGLGGTLDDPAATFTVFAPVNSAFEAIPPGTLNPLIKGAGEPNSALSQILLHHVLPERIEPADLTGEYDTANGDTLTVAGDPEAGVTVADEMVTANVACGGIQTANATVYAIDAVLAGATVKGG